MAFFKIKNITNLLNKRHARFNTVQIIESRTLLDVEKINILPGHEIMLEADHLPVSAQQLRIKGYVLVQELSKNDYLKHIKIREAQIVAEELSVKQTESESLKIEKTEEKRDKKRKFD